MKRILLCLVFMLLACFLASAITVDDIKPDKQVGDIILMTSSDFPINDKFYVYSFHYERIRGQDIVVELEEYKTEAKEDFEKKDYPHMDCNMINFEGQIIRRCIEERGVYYYQFYYKNFIFWIGANSEEDVQKLATNIISKLSLTINNPPQIEEAKTPIKVSLCEPPRMMYEGSCCLDVDNSGVCDMVEEASKRTEELAQEEKAKAEEGIPSQEIPPTETKPAEEIQPPMPSTKGGVNLILPILFLAVVGAIFVVDAIFSFSKKASKKLKKPKKHCQECGATLGPEDDFCPECGEKV